MWLDLSLANIKMTVPRCSVRIKCLTSKTMTIDCGSFMPVKPADTKGHAFCGFLCFLLISVPCRSTFLLRLQEVTVKRLHKMSHRWVANNIQRLFVLLSEAVEWVEHLLAHWRVGKKELHFSRKIKKETHDRNAMQTQEAESARRYADVFPCQKIGLWRSTKCLQDLKMKTAVSNSKDIFRDKLALCHALLHPEKFWVKFFWALRIA